MPSEPNPSETPSADPPPRRRFFRPLILLPFIFLCLSAVFWFATKRREPMYQGQPLSYWLSHIQESGALQDENANALECRNAIRSIGTNAFPTLLRTLRAKDSKLKTVLIDIWERQSLISTPFHTVEPQQEIAAEALQILGDLATNIVPQLIEIHRNPPSAFAGEIADRALTRLYPAGAVLVPYWEPPNERAHWYMRAGMNRLGESPSTNVLIAITAFSRGLELEPTNASIYRMRAEAHLQLDQYTNALADYSKILHLLTTNIDAHLGLALCNFGLKRFEAAEAECNTVIQSDTNNAQAFKVRALARANLRKFTTAADDLNEGISINQYDPSLLRYRAAVEAVQLEYESALGYIKKAIDLDRKDAASWALRSRVMCALKDYQAAITNADIAIRVEPKSPEGYSARAAALLCRDEFAAASADLEKVFSINPSNAVAYLGRGILRMKRGGEDKAAMADFQKAAELAPQIPDGFGMLGLMQYKVGDWDSALTNCRKAISLRAIASVGSYNSYVWLIQAQSGKTNEANVELDQYLRSLEGKKTNEWPAVTARFLTSKISENDFLKSAVTVLKRPSAITNQMCESFFYAGMKRKLAGENSIARDFFQKCLDTKDDNCMAYLNARVELSRLTAEKN